MIEDRELFERAVERFVPPEGSFERLVTANVRVPEVLGDIRAQYTANLTGARRIEDLARRYGVPVLRQAMAQLIEQSEGEMRAAIRALPPGVYTFEDRMDDVGPDTEPVESSVAADVTRLEYTRCADDAAVVLYTVNGGGHSWPGGGPLPEWLVGSTSRSIDATSLMWAFFREHRRSSAD